MICVFCKGNVSVQKVQEELTVGNDHVMVTVDAEVCENCHERYYPSGTVDYLQNLRKEIQVNKSQLKAVGQVYEAC